MWLQFVPWVLIVSGWALVNHQNNLRETRKEARSMADNAKKSAIEIATQSVKFLTIEGVSGLEIKSHLELLEIELERFPQFSNRSSLMKSFTAFADAVTGGDFEAANRSVKLPESTEVGAVFLTRNQLLAEIERQFKIHYC